MIERSKFVGQIKRVAIIFLVAVLGGLIAARFWQDREQFSLIWFTFGFCLTPLYFLVMLIGIQQATPKQSVPIRVTLYCFLATLVLFALFLYANWHWAKVAAACAGLGVALGVFSSVLFIALGPRHQA